MNKKIMKKCLTALFAFLLAVSGILPSPFACSLIKADEKDGDIYTEHTDGNGYWYRETEGGIEITAFTGPVSSDEWNSAEPVELTVPAVLDGKQVIHIGSEAYNGITNGYCRDNITKITIPEGITGIGYAAFRGCKNLEALILPESLTSIERDFINGCNLAEITVPGGVTNIETEAFGGCETLTSINVADENLSYASEDGMLYNKTKTVFLYAPPGFKGNFIIPAHVTEIGNFAFNYCIGLNGITITENVIKIGENAFSSTSLTQLKIPENVKEIGEYAFAYCYELNTIILEEGLETIGSSAFQFCYYHPYSETEWEDMPDITIPASVRELSYDIFNYCPRLQAIHTAEQNQNYASVDGVLYNKNKTEMIRCPEGKIGELIIPASLTDIDTETALERCENLTSINVANGSETFASEDGMLYDKTKETLLYCPMRKAGDALIPASVSSINAVRIFHKDVNITQIIVDAANKTYASEDGILYDRNKTVLLLCPIQKISPSNGAIRIIVPDTVQRIEEDAFAHESGWPKNVTLVCYDGSPAQDYAFAYGMEFEASREARTFTILFDANGGTTAGNTELTGKEGKTISGMGYELPEPQQAGYDFTGWYTAKTGGTQITEETMFTNNQTVYAHWERLSSEDDPTTPNTPPQPENPDTPATPETPAQPGNPATPETPAQPETPANSETPTNPTQPGNQDNPAQPSQTNYTVTFLKNGGSSVSQNSITVAAGQTIGKLPSAERKGYTFKGWYTARKGGVKITSSTQITENRTLYARWQKVAKPPKIKSFPCKVIEAARLRLLLQKSVVQQAMKSVIPRRRILKMQRNSQPLRQS